MAVPPPPPSHSSQFFLLHPPPPLPPPGPAARGNRNTATTDRVFFRRLKSRASSPRLFLPRPPRPPVSSTTGCGAPGRFRYGFGTSRRIVGGPYRREAGLIDGGTGEPPTPIGEITVAMSNRFCFGENIHDVVKRYPHTFNGTAFLFLPFLQNKRFLSLLNLPS